jgi:hypothetical protein
MSTPQGKGTAIPFPYSPEKAIAKQIIQRAIAHIKYLFLAITRNCPNNFRTYTQTLAFGLITKRIIQSAIICGSNHLSTFRIGSKSG